MGPKIGPKWKPLFDGSPRMVIIRFEGKGIFTGAKRQKSVGSGTGNGVGTGG
jgi:hypothetical protein